MCEVLGGDGPDLFGGDGRDGGSGPVEGDEFHFVHPTLGMNVDHRPDVAGSKAFIGEVGRQDHAVVFLDHGHQYFRFSIVGKAIKEMVCLLTTGPLLDVERLPDTFSAAYAVVACA